MANAIIGPLSHFCSHLYSCLVHFATADWLWEKISIQILFLCIAWPPGPSKFCTHARAIHYWHGNNCPNHVVKVGNFMLVINKDIQNSSMKKRAVLKVWYFKYSCIEQHYPVWFIRIIVWYWKFLNHGQKALKYSGRS